MSKNPQRDCVKPEGGGQGPFTQCVKKHPIWQRMASLKEETKNYKPSKQKNYLKIVSSVLGSGTKIC